MPVELKCLECGCVMSLSREDNKLTAEVVSSGSTKDDDDEEPDLIDEILGGDDDKAKK